MAVLTKFEKEDFAKILENFSIGKYKSHKHISWALGNTVYILRTTRGKFILKIYENSDPKFIDFQIKIMQLMEKEKLPSPKIMETTKGKSLLIFNNQPIVVILVGAAEYHMRKKGLWDPSDYGHSLFLEYCKKLNLRYVGLSEILDTPLIQLIK